MGRITVCTVTILLFTALHCPVEASYGDNCAGDTTVCATAGDHLECDPVENKCLCANRPNAYYETADGTCKHVVGQPCDDPPQPDSQSCPLNGWCDPLNPAKLCTCIGGFPETATHKCARPYEGACAQTTECDRDNFVECLDLYSTGPRCVCDLTTSVYENPICKLKASQPCTDPASQVGAQPCSTWTSCKDENGFKCVCDTGLTEDSNGECKALNGNPCGGSNPGCLDSAFLTCPSGTCECLGGTSLAEYDNINKMCYLQNTAPCTNDPNEQPCDTRKYLACDGTSCGCGPDATMDGANGCVLNYDKPCSNAPNAQMCDGNKFLTCESSSNKCGCKGGTEWDGDKCFKKQGEACVVGAGEQKCDENKYFECKNGVCDCADGAILDPLGSGVCVLNFDKICSNDATAQKCDSSKFLTCESSHCGCKTGTQWDGDNCVKKQGEACVIGSGEQTCDEKKFFGCKNGFCDCAADAIMDPQGTGECVLNEGSACPGAQKCDESKFLLCESGTCGCGAGAIANPSTHVCILNHLSLCGDGTAFPLQKCDESKFFGCNGGVCNCAADAILDPGTDECVLLGGSACVVATGAQKCDESKFLRCEAGVCECGIEATEDPITHVCILNHLSPCGAAGHFSSQKCDEDNWVTCVDDKACGCKTGETWSEATGMCVIAEGGTCFSGAQPCDSTNFFICDPNSGKCSCDVTDSSLNVGTGQCELKYQADCVDDPTQQQCHQDEFLQCNNGQCNCGSDAVYVNGVCALRYGSTCSRNVTIQPCDSSIGLECVVGNFCDCPRNVGLVYDQFSDSCVLVEGSTCIEDIQCGVNALCSDAQHQCQCNAGFEGGSVGNCVRGHDTYCGGDIEDFCDAHGAQTCNPGSNLCACLYPEGMEYDPLTKRCNSKLGGPCSSGAQLIPCTTPSLVCDVDECKCNSAVGYENPENGICIKPLGKDCNINTDPNNGGCGSASHAECKAAVCSCITGYEEHDAKCFGTYNATCEKLDDCYLGGSFKCGPNAKCECYYATEQEYDSVKKMCLGIQGSFCNQTDAGVPRLCKDGLTCKQSGSDPIVWQCVGGASYGESCAVDKICDASQFLVCNDASKICQCDNSLESYWEELDGTCHLFYGAQCQSGPSYQLCPINGFCDVISIDQGQCSCDPSYNVTVSGKCKRPYMGDCTTDSECDDDAFMHCLDYGSKKSCKCVDSTSVYDSTSNSCRLKAGQPCVEFAGENEQKCTKFSQCKEVSGGDWICQCDEGLIDNGQGECR